MFIMTLGFDPEFAPNMKVQLNLSFSELQISSFECILGLRKILHELCVHRKILSVKKNLHELYGDVKML